MRALRLLVGAALSTLGLATAPAQAELRALVVGINSYPLATGPLRGAVNDANAVSAALRERKAAIEVLLEKQATRAAVLNAWNRIEAAAKPGDVVIFSFSGHGSKYPADFGKDVFLLANFDTKNPKTADEVFTDDEVQKWTKRLEAKRATVLIFADSCHAGVLVRSADKAFGRENLQASRQAFIPQDMVSDTLEQTKSTPRLPFPNNVFVFAAVSEKLKTYEVPIDGTVYGALSYYVSRGLSGNMPADQNSDGKVTARELADYLTMNVRSASKQIQVPQFKLPAPETALFVKDRVERRQIAFPELPPKIRLKVVGAKVMMPRDAFELATLVDDKDADLFWNTAAEKVMNATGDLIAEGVKPEGIRHAIDVVRLRKVVDGLMAQGIQMSVAMRPDDRLLTLKQFNVKQSGAQRISIEANDPQYKAYTVFNIAGDGTLQYLFPSAGDASRVVWKGSGPWAIDDVGVEEPFGADTVIVIATREPLVELHKTLRAQHNGKDIAALYETLRAHLVGREFHIGMTTRYTAKE